VPTKLTSKQVADHVLAKSRQGWALSPEQIAKGLDWLERVNQPAPVMIETTGYRRLYKRAFPVQQS
jgi:hypothetical protein